MKKTAAKFFIIGERYNPQIGTYLSRVYVGKRRDNKASITCVFDNFGSRESLRFSLCANTTDGSHYCLNTGRCVYGSMSYYGFETAELAKAYLKKNWSKHRNFACCIKQLSI